MKREAIILKILFLFIICTIFLYPVPSFTEVKKTKIAIVEFELRGERLELKDAEKIVPELLITELEKLKKYDIEERLLLAKVLEEQKLSATGLIEESTATKIGNLFGVDAIVTGTIMKLENEITINARIISTSKGEVISSGMVKFTNIKQLKEQIEILANQLCGISPEKLKEKKEIKERERTRYQLEIGILSGIVPNKNFSRIALFYGGLAFQSSLLDIYASAAPPLLPSFAMAQAGLFFNITPFIGIGGEWTLLDFFNLGEGGEIHCFNSRGLGLGIKFRPSTSLTARVIFGGMYDGEVWMGSEAYSIIPQYKFPPTYMSIHIENKIDDTFGINGILIWCQPYYDGPIDNDSGENRVTAISAAITVTYSFTLAGN